MSRNKRMMTMTLLMMNEHIKQFPNDKVITPDLVGELFTYYEMMYDINTPIHIRLAAAASFTEIIEELIPVLEKVTAKEREKGKRNG